MSILGEDLAGGMFRRLYQPTNPSGVVIALAGAVVMVVLYQLLQLAMSLVVAQAFFGDPANTRSMVKASLVVIFPCALLVVAGGWWLAGRSGLDPREVLNLRVPRFTWLGWLVVIGGFMVVMYGCIMLLVLALGIDLAEYTPGPNGQSPSTGSSGLVKEAMFDIANEPLLFLLVFPSIAIGAPVVEELIFRGQLFSSLSQTRLGVSGATVLTAAMWSMLHVSEPWLAIGLIFIMGLVFGWMMFRFNSLYVTIACHGVWNGVYALLIFFGQGSSA